MKAITVCVEYEDLLALTLPGWLRHFSRIVVVTSPCDAMTPAIVGATIESGQSIAAGCELVCHATDAFYRGGAAFNKGLAIEEGFDVLGRDGWIMVLDADVVLPARLPLDGIAAGNLYGPIGRRMVRDPAEYDGREDWSAWPILYDREHAGCCQVFHASDPVLRERPWYGIDWRHAGGCDSDFQAKWPPERRLRLPFEVLHLGPDCCNWHGRVTPRLDGRPNPNQEARARAQAEMVRLRGQHGTRFERLGDEGVTR